MDIGVILALSILGTIVGIVFMCVVHMLCDYWGCLKEGNQLSVPCYV